MTVESFEKAINIREQIESINEILDKLSVFTYECLPPTRMTNVDISISHNELINLNEGEVICLRDALESRKAVLRREFERL